MVRPFPVGMGGLLYGIKKYMEKPSKNDKTF
jgi:hypothetical protein